MSEANQELNFSIHSFGCKVNTYDSGLLEQRLKSAGWQRDAGSGPRVHVLNTCAVTAEATKEALRRIRRIKAQDPLSLVVVTGCAAQVDTDQFSDLPGADLVVANSHKGDLVDLIRCHYAGTLKQKVFKSNIFKKEDLEAGGGEESHHTRSFLKIQDGCNSFCTFCVIPFARGKSRSIPIDQLVQRVRELEGQGVAEVVLTGVHIGDYFDDSMGQGKGLEDLVEAILRQTRMGRLRLSSLEPIELSSRLLELYSDPRLCPHFHMSLQSADTKVLADMKRKYGQPEVERALTNIAKKVKGAFVGMDVIAGFPGETDAEFENTYQALNNLPWTKIHVFPYSVRPGTFAARRPELQLPAAVIVQRASRLRQLSHERYHQEALNQVGSRKKVLVLRSSRQSTGVQSALARDYWNIQLHSRQGDLPVGEELEVQIQGYHPLGNQRMDSPLMAQI